MTRMERWQSYRSEIAKQSHLGQDINADKAKIYLYKQEIDRINPAILSLSDKELSLESGVSNVKIEKKEIANEIADMFATINVAKNTINDENVETLFYQMKNESVVQDDEFKKEFLDRHDEYKYFEANAAEFLEDKQDDATSKDLEAKFNTFQSKPNESHKIDSMGLLSNNNQKQASHYVFVISVAVSIFLLVVVMALFVTRLVIR